VSKGAKVLTGGNHRPDLGPYFFEPTVLTGVTPSMECYAEETFGPVVSVYTFRTDDEAVELANDTRYGLSGGVWGGDASRAEEVARRLRTGQVEVNGGSFNPLAPFGGYKMSGNGRELGAYGLEEYLEVKAVATPA